MSKIYDKSVKELIVEFVNKFDVSKENDPFGLRKNLNDGGYFSREEILSWFRKKYAKIKKGTINAHLLLLSTNAKSRKYYNVHDNGKEDLLFQIDSDKFRKYIPKEDPQPIRKEIVNKKINISQNREFATEEDFKKFLIKNLEIIEPGLVLFKDGEINGIEYPVGNRFIDILAIDSNKDYVVIELKVSRAYDKVVGQLLRYMGWIEKNQIENGQKVKGIIIARKISTDLKIACSKVKDISLLEYDLSVYINKVEY